MAKKSPAIASPAPVAEEVLTEATKPETPATEETPTALLPEPVVVATPETPDTIVEDKPTVVLKKKKTIVT